MARVPSDFPRIEHEGALPGAQAKYIAREIDGKFVVGLTNEEVFERYEECSNIVRQLIPLFQEQLKKYPDYSEARHLTRLRHGIRAKQWCVTRAEIDWMVEEVRRQIPPPASLGDPL